MQKKSKFNHLSQANRAVIENGLNKRRSIHEIAHDIEKEPSSVLREIERNSIYEESQVSTCEFIHTCQERHVCGNLNCYAICSKKCSYDCYKNCKLFKKRTCDKLNKSPYVCNGCPRLKNRSCQFDRKVYNASHAHQHYREILKSRRAGFDLTAEELKNINDIISPLIKKGQSPYHIWKSNNLDISISTIYRIIENGDIDAKNIDLLEKVRRKPRKRKRKNMHESSQSIQISKIGHLWEDFQKYINDNDVMYVEMDCVEGKKDEKPALLTLHYPSFHFQLAIYLSKHNAACVVEAFNSIEHAIGTNMFMQMFPVILTDNGSEFSDIDGMETSCLDTSRKRTKIFFCEPNRSDQKGACENNHKMIRRIIKKGTSLRKYNQEDISLIMNHINSYRRKKVFGKSAFDLIEGIFPEQFLDALGCYRIPDNEIILSPKLFSDMNK